MTDPAVCPNCGGNWTDHVETEMHDDRVYLIYVCGDCEAQYSVEFGDPIKEVEYI